MMIRVLLVAVMLCGAGGVAQAQDNDALLVSKMQNCAALMGLISDNSRSRAMTDIADKAQQSSDQFTMASRYYAKGVPAKTVMGDIAKARTKLDYLYKQGGDNALADDIHACGSPELAEKGQAALDAQKQADEAEAAKKGQ